MKIKETESVWSVELVYVQLSEPFPSIIVDSIHDTTESRDARMNELRGFCGRYAWKTVPFSSPLYKMRVWNNPFWKQKLARNPILKYGGHIPKAGEEPYVVMRYHGTDYYDGNHEVWAMAVHETLEKAEEYMRAAKADDAYAQVWATRVKRIDRRTVLDEVRDIYTLENITLPEHEGTYTIHQLAPCSETF